MLRGLSIDE